MENDKMLDIDTSKHKSLNLQILQRKDKEICEIIDTASHAVVYEFNAQNKEWKRKNIEGSLFIVKRYSKPRFQLIVNNRMHLSNMVQDIDNNVQAEVLDQFLIIKCPNNIFNNSYSIFGFWFFPKDDQQRIFNIIKRILRAINKIDSSDKTKQSENENYNNVLQQTNNIENLSQLSISTPSEDKLKTRSSKAQLLTPRNIVDSNIPEHMTSNKLNLLTPSVCVTKSKLLKKDQNNLNAQQILNGNTTDYTHVSKDILRNVLHELLDDPVFF